MSALPTMLPWAWRGVALRTCESTQDECDRLSEGKPGLIVTAMEQTGGRGRQGRTWLQHPGAGLAITVGLDPTMHSAASMSLAAGLAAAFAARTWTVGPSSDTIGVKWPNDVVGRAEGGPLVKLAGVLIEIKRGVALVGIGLNVRHEEQDFAPELCGRAGSILMLSDDPQPVSRLDVLGTLMMELDRLLRMPEAELVELWRQSDVLTGTEQTFEHGGERRRGTVRRIDPAKEIVLEADGRLHRLPAMSTTLIKDDDRRTSCSRNDDARRR